MAYFPPFVVHGTHRATSQDIKGVAERYRLLLEGLVEEGFSNDDIRKVTYLNELIK
jgi:glutathione-regulated potassium-efflux system ancillary protein KefG